MSKFYSLREENALDSGLTELNAASAVDKGFMSHNDWMAHCARYGYAQKIIAREHVETLLDYGCGSLQLPYYLWRNRAPGIRTYWGVDMRAQEAWLQRVGWKTPMNLIRADIILDYPEDHIPEFPYQFDLVVCTEVLEHVPKIFARDLVDRLFAYTRPGGSCILSSPNAGVSDSIAENHVGPEGEREWSYTEKCNLLVSAGFEFYKAYGTFGGSRRLEVALPDIPPEIKEFLPHAWYTTMIAAPYPSLANNALFHMRRPK